MTHPEKTIFGHCLGTERVAEGRFKPQLNMTTSLPAVSDTTNMVPVLSQARQLVADLRDVTRLASHGVLRSLQ